jgi:acetoin utilization deacetylase AcuC-like enzyme
MRTKWKSEAIWRDALESLASQIAEREQPEFILYRCGVLDEAYTRKHVAKMRQRYERIKAGGLEEWRNRYEG